MGRHPKPFTNPDIERQTVKRAHMASCVSNCDT
jgi:hypothetical protein